MQSSPYDDFQYRNPYFAEWIQRKLGMGIVTSTYVGY